jgi:hypothetical protein
LAGDARDQRGFAAIPLLVAGAEPVPALLLIGRRGVSRVGHQKAKLVGELVHARTAREILG